MLKCFFDPDGILVVGASDRGVGANLLGNVCKGYGGRIYPVNPRHETLGGLPCYPAVAEVPDPCDLALYLAPARLLPETIDACAARGVRGMIIESAGFAEAGEAELQHQAVARARRHGMRLWGPNCMGLIDAGRRHVFSFLGDPWEKTLLPGNISLVVQSGMLSAGFLTMILEEGNMHVRTLCSIGNRCDVDENDLLPALMDDDDTAVIGCYLESFHDGRRFLEACRKSPKPVVLLNGGRSPAGAAAALSHTASLGGDHAVAAGALRQGGVIEATDPHEFMDLLRGLATLRPWRGDGGAAIVTFSGAGGILTADLLAEAGVPLARPGAQTLRQLGELYPPWMPASHPADIWPAIEKDGAATVYPAAVRTLLDDPGTGALILHCLANRLDPALADELAGLARTRRVPVVAWLTGNGERRTRFRAALEMAGIPVFTEMGRGVRVLESLYRLRERRVTCDCNPGYKIPVPLVTEV